MAWCPHESWCLGKLHLERTLVHTVSPLHPPHLQKAGLGGLLTSCKLHSYFQFSVLRLPHHFSPSRIPVAWRFAFIRAALCWHRVLQSALPLGSSLKALFAPESSPMVLHHPSCSVSPATVRDSFLFWSALALGGGQPPRFLSYGSLEG